jgi:hypothetical protein
MRQAVRTRNAGMGSGIAVPVEAEQAALEKATERVMAYLESQVTPPAIVEEPPTTEVLTVTDARKSPATDSLPPDDQFLVEYLEATDEGPVATLAMAKRYGSNLPAMRSLACRLRKERGMAPPPRKQPINPNRGGKPVPVIREEDVPTNFPETNTKAIEGPVLILIHPNVHIEHRHMPPDTCLPGDGQRWAEPFTDSQGFACRRLWQCIASCEVGGREIRTLRPYVEESRTGEVA